MVTVRLDMQRERSIIREDTSGRVDIAEDFLAMLSNICASE